MTVEGLRGRMNAASSSQNVQSFVRSFFDFKWWKAIPKTEAFLAISLMVPAIAILFSNIFILWDNSRNENVNCSRYFQHNHRNGQFGHSHSHHFTHDHDHHHSPKPEVEDRPSLQKPEVEDRRPLQKRDANFQNATKKSGGVGGVSRRRKFSKKPSPMDCSVFDVLEFEGKLKDTKIEIQTFGFLGMAIGSALAGYVADKFSKYHSASFMASILILANFVCLETPPVVWRFEATWLLQGVGIFGVIVAMYIRVLELLPTEFRLPLGLGLFSVSWFLGKMLGIGLVVMTRSWFRILYWLSIITTTAILVHQLLPRRISRKRYDALKAKEANDRIPFELTRLFDQKLKKKFLACAFAFFMNGFIVYSMTQTKRSIWDGFEEKSTYRILWKGFISILSTFMIIGICHICRRTVAPYALLMSVNAVMFLINAGFPCHFAFFPPKKILWESQCSENVISQYVLIIHQIIEMISGPSFNILWYLTFSSFPSSVRCTALGFCSAIARIGMTISVYMEHNGQLFASPTAMAFVGVFGLAACLILLYYVEDHTFDDLIKNSDIWPELSAPPKPQQQPVAQNPPPPAQPQQQPSQQVLPQHLEEYIRQIVRTDAPSTTNVSETTSNRRKHHHHHRDRGGGGHHRRRRQEEESKTSSTSSSSSSDKEDESPQCKVEGATASFSTSSSTSKSGSRGKKRRRRKSKKTKAEILVGGLDIGEINDKLKSYVEKTGEENPAFENEEEDEVEGRPSVAKAREVIRVNGDDDASSSDCSIDIPTRREK